LICRIENAVFRWIIFAALWIADRAAKYLAQLYLSAAAGNESAGE